MSTIFTLADYDNPDGDPIELYEDDWASYRTFWAAVLQVATADRADAVYYDLDRGDDCLVIEIGNKSYSMAPPPVTWRDKLLATTRRLAAGGPLRAAVRYLLRVWNQSDYLGRFVLRIPGQEVKWDVYALSNGVRVQRPHTPTDERAGAPYNGSS